MVKIIGFLQFLLKFLSPHYFARLCKFDMSKLFKIIAKREPGVRAFSTSLGKILGQKVQVSTLVTHFFNTFKAHLPSLETHPYLAPNLHLIPRHLRHSSQSEAPLRNHRRHHQLPLHQGGPPRCISAFASPKSTSSRSSSSPTP